MNPPNAEIARIQVRELLSLPRIEKSERHLSSAAKHRHLRRAETVTEVIYQRWKVGIWRWKEKHVLWYTNVYIADFSQATRYQYGLTVRRICRATRRKFANRGPVS